MAKTSDTASDLSDQMRQAFLVPLEVDQPEFLETLRGARAPFDELGKAFQFNLRSVVSMVAFPFFLASSSALDSHFMRIYLAEKIRARGISAEQNESDEALESRRDSAAQKKAGSRMKQFRDSKEGTDAIVSDISRFLLGATANEELAMAAADLLLQGAALTWGAFEILARDVFVAYLNQTPRAVANLVKNPIARNKFELPKVSVEDLAAHEFDLSSSMGTFLARQQDFSALPVIKDVYSALFPAANPLTEKLNQNEIWILSQQRHLIVHKKGIVDEKYKANARSVDDVGKRLVVRPIELEKHIELVRDAGRALLDLVG